ncbi:dihydroorotase [Prochlorothrix hollandica]|uniref:dihydroorotase n=1 Tax=Prochlorothrix hollandica TaxID=1223 RepID=UPI003341A085
MGADLLEQVRVLDPQGGIDRITDVLIPEPHTLIVDPQPDQIPRAVHHHPAQGQILAPGLVDLHGRSGQPGHEDRETWESLAAAALGGGFTQLGILPNTRPPLDQAELVSQRCGQSYPVQFHHWGALTLGCQGQQMTELAELAAAGVVGFSDGSPIQDWALVRRILEYGQPLAKPMALWPWNRDLAGTGVARDGVLALRYGLSGVPGLAETLPLAGLLECVAELGTPLHLMRLSTARGVELVAQAKAQGLPITASTTWLHLLHNTEDLASYDPNLRLSPPLGNPEDQHALIAAVASGVIDAIATDHAPYTYEEKTVAFGEAPAGSIGLELILPLLWQTFVAPGHWSALDLWRCLCLNPARILGLVPPSLVTGNGGWVWFDPQRSWPVEAASLRSRSCNTSYLGQTLQGQVLKTVASRSVLVNDGLNSG